ncbi:integrin alpha-5 [Caerostris extrusa]|uniref:Integrin alpha-5 n=1 Tax=Caerostris extrusa TaxID=172846 RepID=A0AAV4S5N8_CAEEX|nr:integrin alpha-5 [Caerostris extrusa]
MNKGHPCVAGGGIPQAAAAFVVDLGVSRQMLTQCVPLCNAFDVCPYEDSALSGEILVMPPKLFFCNIWKNVWTEKQRSINIELIVINIVTKDHEKHFTHIKKINDGIHFFQITHPDLPPSIKVNQKTNMRNEYDRIDFECTPNKAVASDPVSFLRHQLNYLGQRQPSFFRFEFSINLIIELDGNELLVGAPKAQTDQPGVEQGGAVFRCSIDSPDMCQMIPFDASGPGQINLRGKKENMDEKSHQWFGATVHSSGENGAIVACAPRYVSYSSNLKRRDPVGTCWVVRGTFKTSRSMHPAGQEYSNAFQFKEDDILFFKLE